MGRPFPGWLESDHGGIEIEKINHIAVYVVIELESDHGGIEIVYGIAEGVESVEKLESDHGGIEIRLKGVFGVEHYGVRIRPWWD